MSKHYEFPGGIDLLPGKQGEAVTTGGLRLVSIGGALYGTTDGVTFTQVGGGAGTVSTDATLQGNGSGGTPLTNAVTKLACVVATTANITLSGAQTIDGVAVVAGNRVLVTAQTDATTNGIYACASGAWTRATDFASAAQMIACIIGIQQGTKGTGQLWLFTTSSAITVGTTALTFTLVPGSGVLAGQTLAQSRLILRPEYFFQVAGASIQTITLSGLDGNTDGDYLIDGKVVNGHGGASYTFGPNSQVSNLAGAGYTPAAGQADGAGWAVYAGATFPAGVSVNLTFTGKLTIRTGLPRSFAIQGTIGDTGAGVFLSSGVWTDTSTNMTSFQLISNQTDGLAAGSFLRLTAIGLS